MKSSFRAREFGNIQENKRSLSEKDENLLKTERIKFANLIELSQANGFDEDLLKLVRNVGGEPGEENG